MATRPRFPVTPAVLARAPSLAMSGLPGNRREASEQCRSRRLAHELEIVCGRAHLEDVSALLLGQLDRSAEVSVPCVLVVECVRTQAQQFGVVELYPGVLPHLQGDVQVFTRCFLIARGDQQPSQDSVVERRGTSSPRTRARSARRWSWFRCVVPTWPDRFHRRPAPVRARPALCWLHPTITHSSKSYCLARELSSAASSAPRVRFARFAAKQRLDRSPVAQTERAMWKAGGVAPHFHLLQCRPPLPADRLGRTG